MTALTAEQANAVYDVLVQHAGARSEDREIFVILETGSWCREYRFQGKLGFGGKFYVDPDTWRVGCYREDLTADRQQILDVTNAALSGLRASFVALDEALS